MVIPLLILLLTTPKSLTLEYNHKSYTIEAQIFDGFTYLSLNDLQTAFGFTVTSDSNNKRFTVEHHSRTVVLIPDNPWIVLDSSLLNLPLASQYSGGKLWLPIPVLNEIIVYFLSQGIRVNGSKLITYPITVTIEKIVVDAGHGGKDPGGIGHNGLQEKGIVLDIAKTVVQLLESELGLTCLLTRDDDTFIPLSERTKIANEWKADLFLSIHCNWAWSRNVCGSEVYFLSPAKTTWERAVEARENASLKYEIPDWKGEVGSILWDMAQTEFLQESNVLSCKLVDSISDTAGTKNNGVKQANFFVLRGAYMPACLVEAEFVSNPEGEKNLGTKEFRTKIARGIVQGIQEFKEWYEERMN